MPQRALATRREDPEEAPEAAGVDGTIEGRRAACPLCEVSTTDARQLYVHLQTSHRKSTLAGIVVGEL
jgi:hypothetical protein